MVRNSSIWLMDRSSSINNCIRLDGNKNIITFNMAKKEIKDDKFPKEDYDNLMKLFRHIGPFYDKEQNFIYEMLRKYIDPNHPRPIASCNCPMSYAAAFNKLRDWTSQNGHKFNS